ncbi:MAG: hypothetical protein WBC91_16345 [Phototrophicaceae bacterium]
MVFAIVHIIGLFGFIAIGIALVILGRLSARLGKVTQARSYYLGNYLAACLIWLSVAFRFYFITRGQSNMAASDGNLVYILGVDGLLAFGITLGLIVTWYYWSWLLAERD